jgi:perosamine synthetase
MSDNHIPFFRPSLTQTEIDEVVATLRSGWLTSGPKVKRFEQDFAAAVGAPHAVALNSCTAALHLAVEALNLRPGEAVLVPTMTFAATAEIVRYQGAMPILVDCDPVTGNMDLVDAEKKIAQLNAATLSVNLPRDLQVTGMIPVHVGGLMMDIAETRRFAARYKLWLVEDAAHAFPSAWRPGSDQPWQRCGEGTADVSCFSFYANKTITTGEGGMAVTHDAVVAERLRLMSLHGLSHDAWGRYEKGGNWDYQIVAPGYKYNLTDIAAAIGIHQLARAEEMQRQREEVANHYLDAFADLEEIELPPVDANRRHSWHLFPIKLNLSRLSVDRNDFIEQLKQAGVGCSVHWRPLHLHPYYKQTLGWQPKDLPIATALWERLISLPIFPDMQQHEVAAVIRVVTNTCRRNARRSDIPARAKVDLTNVAGSSYVR